MKRKTVSIIKITLVLLVLFFAVLYFLGAKSNAYLAAENYIKQNVQIEKEFGKITESRLALFGYSIEETGPKGKADLEVVIYSKNKKGSVYVSLEKITGKWIIKRARLKQADSIFITLELPAQ